MSQALEGTFNSVTKCVLWIYSLYNYPTLEGDEFFSKLLDCDFFMISIMFEYIVINRLSQSQITLQTQIIAHIYSHSII